MSDILAQLDAMSRRRFLGSLSMGLGAASLSQWPGALPGVSAAGLAPPPLRPKAKRVIFLCMAGGPSHLETFDHKPRLVELDGQPMPESYTQGMPIAQLQGKELRCLGSRATFRRHGESGQSISDYLPHIATCADDIAIVNSMVTEQINHDPAHTFMNTGTIVPDRPSMGSWVNYGLGSLSENLPGFVVLTSVGGRNPQPIAARQWSSGFLPSKLSGVEFHGQGDPVHYVANPPGITTDCQSSLVDAVAELNRLRAETTRDPEIDSRIAQHELAFRMQASIPELMDISEESTETLEMYGAVPGDGSFASNCLLARRLAERGVRFIHLYHRGWDHHGGLKQYMDVCCDKCDQPTAALLQDLKRRGMLEDTLVVWGGEFGRTPMSQGGGSDPGRDHHIKGFSMFLAGGGVRGGVTHGATDELGYDAVQDVVHVRDLHATMLHLLGLDHQRLSVPHQGLDVRLTGVEPARIVREIIA
ncbi:MAG: sulfatase [Planctomycetaceae bacterium]|nr:sulfatase [Planctomycetaceae bacterium]